MTVFAPSGTPGVSNDPSVLVLIEADESDCVVDSVTADCKDAFLVSAPVGSVDCDGDWSLGDSCLDGFVVFSDLSVAGDGGDSSFSCSGTSLVFCGVGVILSLSDTGSIKKIIPSPEVPTSITSLIVVIP